MSTAALRLHPQTAAATQPRADLPSVAPSVEEVDRIAAMSDLVLRNLLITRSYHLLSNALARSLGTCANWCTHATWASKQAGQTIRREDLARILEIELAAAPGLSKALGEVISAAAAFGSRLDPLGMRFAGTRTLLGAVVLERVSNAISRGNHKVFAEIGREVARFLETVGEDKAFDATRIARFLEGLRPGELPEGQAALRRAFTHFYEARFESHPKARAERILLANLEIGFHEQTRLQPEIQDALESALPDREDLRKRMLQALFPRAGMLLRLRLRLPRALRRMNPLDRALDHLLDELRRLLRRTLTEVLMRLELPGGRVLRLGRDLSRSFPLSLRTIEHPELRELLKLIDPTRDSVLGSGAEDWADFNERMHFIADFFRGFQEDRSLLEPPFTPAQMNAMLAGRRPIGRL
jgi:hypothetical protein